MINIASHLPKMAAHQPDAPAVIIQKGLASYDVCSFQKLNEDSDAMAAELEAMGIKKGVRTALLVRPGMEFFAITFGVFKVGAIPVLIDPGIGVRNMGKCLREAQPEVFIGITQAHIARILLGWARESVKTVITVGPKLGWGGFTFSQLLRAGRKRLPYKMPELDEEQTAAILFTSGSTGVPKGAVYTHEIFNEQVKALRDEYGITPGEIDLATFPLFALFGPALGMTALIPDMDATRPAQADPRRLIAAIKKWKATNMFGSPALLDGLSRYGEKQGERLSSLRRVISAGAPARPEVLARMKTILEPGVQVFTPYGATEALPVSSIGSDRILGATQKGTARGQGVCVGKPLAQIEVAIIKINDDPISTWTDELRETPGKVGEIVVKGTVVTRSYFNREAATLSAKIQDPDAGGFWHRMGDVGYIDEDGSLWMCGRKTHRVTTAEGVLFTIPCEGVFNVHPGVFRTALVGVPLSSSYQKPVLCVELEKNGMQSEEMVKAEVLKLGSAFEHTRAITEILFHPGFPVDIRHNAKIFREKLAAWAAKRVG